MKYILAFIGVVVVGLGIFFCGGGKQNINDDYMRIHVVANSNDVNDQNIKYIVKDAVVEFLLPQLAQAENKEEAVNIIENNIKKINEVAENALRKCGANYGVNISIEYEDMPTRAYDNMVLEAGTYECLKIELGSAKGDNWWCVVFPAVCFIDTKNFEKVEYISKIWEILNYV